MASPIIETHPQRDQILRRLRKGDSVAKTARDFGLNGNTLKSWWDRHKDEVLADMNAESGDIRELARETIRLRQANEILSAREQVSRAQVEELEHELSRLREIASVLEPTSRHQSAPPTWMVPKRNGKAHRGTVNLVLSDLHLDEVVRPEEVNYVNAFNRRIAEQRLRRTFEKACTLPRDYLSGIAYDGIVVHLAGDTFSGDIHEELARSNEAHPLESVLHWVDPFVAGIRMLEETYGKVHLVSVPGNHDRTTRKPIHKGRVVSSLHFLHSKLLEREFKGNKAVTWDIPETPDVMTVQYGFRTMTTHGDRFRGGSGIGGILVPILRGDARMRQRQQAVDQPYDLLVMGHFHQYVNGPGVLINGSLKGYDEYAWNNSFPFEPPQQALFVVTPEQGDMLHLPIRCMKKSEERWGR